MPLPENKSGSAMSEAERIAELDEIIRGFGEWISRKSRCPGISGEAAILHKLVEVHHWTPSQCEKLTRPEIALCLPELWLEFFHDLSEEDRQFLRDWPHLHQCPVPAAEESRR